MMGVHRGHSSRQARTRATVPRVPRALSIVWTGAKAAEKPLRFFERGSAFLSGPRKLNL